MAEENPANSESPVILIDGGCVLCNHFARFVLRNDPGGTFWFAPQDSAWARARGLSPASGAAGDSILLWQGGRVLSRSDAALRIFGGLRFPWKLAGALRIIPRPLREAAYSFVAHNRYRWFGRVDCCGLLTPQEKTRILDGDAL